MHTNRKLARRVVFIGAAGAGSMVLATATALAISILLPAGGNLAVPSTTSATEPDLAGVVIHDELVPFSIMTPAGAILCQGRLQDRVVRSTKTQRVHFYYRIRDTSGTGAVNRIVTTSFAGLALRVAYRTDGLGTVPPRRATRSMAPGTTVVLTMSDPPVSCAQHQESRFILIKTAATAFHAGGTTRIVATTGATVAVPTVVP